MTMIIDGSSGATFPDSSVQISAGKVLQVVNATYTTYTTTTSTSYADTGLSATITPKFSTSKILCFVDMAGCSKEGGATGAGLYFKLLRGSTTILTFEQIGGFNGSISQFNGIGSCSCNYLDSPATTSATTYKVQFANNVAGGAIVSICNYLSATAPSCTMTLMEIAA